MYRTHILQILSKLFSSTLFFSRVTYSPTSHEFFRYAKSVITSVDKSGTALRRENFEQIRWKHWRASLDHSRVPKIDEKDLEEQFVRGSGPGGQATAKTNNAVVLKHKPTGIVVKCHETRSQWENKKRAREILINKLDVMINGELSLEAQERAVMAKKSAKRARKNEKMRNLKAAFKEREGID